MANKTQETSADVEAFIQSFADTEQKRKDSFELLKLMESASGYEGKMWGPSIIGFGKYHYKSERSKQEGDWMMVGFSPRKAAISLYVYAGLPEQKQLLTELGKFRMGQACIYVKKLSDIHLDTLQKLIQTSIRHYQTKKS